MSGACFLAAIRIGSANGFFLILNEIPSIVAREDVAFW
jgi:hypothetical protein